MDYNELRKQLFEEFAIVKDSLDVSKKEFEDARNQYRELGITLEDRVEKHVSKYLDDSRARFIRVAATDALKSLRKFPSEEPSVVEDFGLTRAQFNITVLGMAVTVLEKSMTFPVNTGDVLQALKKIPIENREKIAHNLSILSKAIELARFLNKTEFLVVSTYRLHLALLQLYLGEGDQEEIRSLFEAIEEVTLSDFKSEATDIAVETAAEILEVSVDTLVPVWRLFRIVRLAYKKLIVTREDMFLPRGDLDDLGDLTEVLDHQNEAMCELKRMLQNISKTLEITDGAT